MNSKFSLFLGWDECTIHGDSYFRYNHTKLISNDISNRGRCALACKKEQDCEFWSFDESEEQCALISNAVLDNNADKEKNDRIRGDRNCFPCFQPPNLDNSSNNYKPDEFYDRNSTIRYIQIRFEKHTKTKKNRVRLSRFLLFYGRKCYHA